MIIRVLKKGDSVLNVTEQNIIVKRKSGEVDIIPLRYDEVGLNIDVENITTIGYGDNIIESKMDNGVCVYNF